MRNIIPFVFLIFSHCAIANSVDFGLGAGVKYGGVLGGQVSLSHKRNNIRAALGLFGGSVGYDFKILNKFSVGLTYGEISWVYENVAALNFTYHWSGEYNKGWNIGLDLGRARRSSGICFSQQCADDAEDRGTSTSTSFSFGYTF